MDAVEFNIAKGIMCDNYKYCRDGCALHEAIERERLTCDRFCYDHPEEAVKLVEDWWKEHKPKTNAEWVKEKLEEIGYAVDLETLKLKCPSRYSTYYGAPKENCNGISSRTCSKCRKWWDEPHEEK